MALMVVLAGNIRAVFAWAVVPAVLAVLVLVFAVREPRPVEGVRRPRLPIRWGDVLAMGGGFWAVIALGAVFTMARFSEAFLVLRAQDVGLAIALVPVVMVVMNLVYSAVAAPAGSLSDRMDRRWLLVLGLAVLIAADVVLALVATVPGVLLGVALWGLHMGLTQGLLAALVADTAPSHLRGTAFGLFNLASGATLLAASVVAGLLWSRMGPEATFIAGAVFALLATIWLVSMTLRHPGRRNATP
jgi:MFS family permease